MKIKIPFHTQISALILVVVIGFVAVLNYTAGHLKDALVDQRIAATKDIVSAAHSIVSTINTQVKDGKINVELGQFLAKEELRHMRYSNGEYLWIHNTNGFIVMHPILPEIEGTSILAFKNVDGVQLFRLLSKAIKEGNGEGHVQYHWPKPGQSDAVEKVSYIKEYKEWEWVIGAGVYVDELDANYNEKLRYNFIIIFLASILITIIAYMIINKLRKAVFTDN